MMLGTDSAEHHYRPRIVHGVAFPFSGISHNSFLYLFTFSAFSIQLSATATTDCMGTEYIPQQMP